MQAATSEQEAEERPRCWLRRVLKDFLPIAPEEAWQGVMQVLKFLTASIALGLAILLPSKEQGGYLPTETSCLVAPRLEDMRTLRIMLACFTVLFLVQLWAPAWALCLFLERRSAQRRSALGTLAAVANTALIAYILSAGEGWDSHPSNHSPPDITSFNINDMWPSVTITTTMSMTALPTGRCKGGGIGLFEFFAFCSNLEVVFLPQAVLAICCGYRRLAPEPENRSSGNRGGVDPATCGTLIAYPETDPDEKLPRDCAICLRQFESGESCRQLPCHERHIFHDDCAAGWLQKTGRCPLCRKTAWGTDDEELSHMEMGRSVGQHQLPREEAEQWSLVDPQDEVPEDMQEADDEMEDEEDESLQSFALPELPQSLPNEVEREVEPPQVVRPAPSLPRGVSSLSRASASAPSPVMLGSGVGLSPR